MYSPTQIEEQLLSIKELSPHYHISIAKQGNLDRLTLQVEAKQAADTNSQLLMKNLQHKNKILYWNFLSD